MCSAEILVKEVTFQINRTTCFTPAWSRACDHLAKYCPHQCVGDPSLLDIRLDCDNDRDTVICKTVIFCWKETTSYFIWWFYDLCIFNAYPLAIPWTLVKWKVELLKRVLGYSPQKIITSSNFSWIISSEPNLSPNSNLANFLWPSLPALSIMVTV